MNKKLEKRETLIAILSIVIYVVINSYVRQNYGETSCINAIVNVILSMIFVLYIMKFKLGDYYSLKKFPNCKKFLYFIPFIILASVNLWSGININFTCKEIVFYSVSMLCIGFIEEIIFRGFLFRMMEKDNLKRAIIVTSLTFGIGHVVNLINGADFISTLMQMCYAVCIGYSFAVVLVKGKSLWPCIITHSIINMLSIYNTQNTMSVYIIPIVIIVVSLGYAYYLNKTIKTKTV